MLVTPPSPPLLHKGGESGPLSRRESDRIAAPPFSLPIPRLPDIRGEPFKPSRSPVWPAAIAQLVEHVIRNDGVTGSSPVCGTTFPSRNILSHPRKSISRR